MDFVYTYRQHLRLYERNLWSFWQYICYFFYHRIDVKPILLVKLFAIIDTMLNIDGDSYCNVTCKQAFGISYCINGLIYTVTTLVAA